MSLEARRYDDDSNNVDLFVSNVKAMYLVIVTVTAANVIIVDGTRRRHSLISLDYRLCS